MTIFGQPLALCINFCLSIPVRLIQATYPTYTAVTAGTQKKIGRMGSVATMGRKVTVSIENTVGQSPGLAALNQAKVLRLTFSSFGHQTVM